MSEPAEGQAAPQRAGRAQRLRRAALLALLFASALWLVVALGPASEAPLPPDPPSPAAEGAPGAAAAGAPPEAGREAPAAEDAGAEGELRPLPACTFGSEPAPLSAPGEWRHTLLDTSYRLEPEYAPTDLVSIPAALAHIAEAGLAGADHRLREVATDALVALFEEAEAAGVQLAVQSAYRSYAYQESTFAYWVEVDGYEAALATSARAGHSEHQLGTAVDLRSRSGPPAWELEDWAATADGAWVAANAHRFGFVMSYPPGRESESCYSYEPWHFRYVGRDLAQTIHSSGATPRAVLWRHAEERLLAQEQAGGGR